jgi:putative transposase
VVPPLVTELKYHFVKTQYSYQVLRGDIVLRLRELIKEVSAEKGVTVVRGDVWANRIHGRDSPRSPLPGQDGAVPQRPPLISIAARVPRTVQARLGTASGGRGYFCTTAGAVTEEQIKRSIDSQEDSPTFHV